jgi:hypothetical protein
MRDGWKLSEDEVRAKVVELLLGMNQTRMDLWSSSGIIAGVLDSDMVARVLTEEVVQRPPHVQEFWLGQPCTCGLKL